LRDPRISAGVAPRRCSTVVRPMARSSSTSSAACQTNRYGVIVVPRKPTNVAIHILSRCISGTIVCRSASPQFTPTTNALATYASSDKQSHFTIEANCSYDAQISTMVRSAPKPTAQTLDGTWVTNAADADMPATSAAMFSVFAPTTSTTSVRRSQAGITCRIAAIRPVPVTIPMRAHISWTAIIIGTVINATQSRPKPRLAPAIEYVAMPDGSSSAAPVMIPGPMPLIEEPMLCRHRPRNETLTGRPSCTRSPAGRRGSSCRS
jgi:hypothetical protein